MEEDSFLYWMHGKQYRGKYLVIGSTNHMGEVDSFEWTDPTLQQLTLGEYHTFILHFDAIPTQVITQAEASTRIVIRNTENQLELLANIDLTILANLKWISSNLVEHPNQNQLKVFIIASPINRFNLHFFQQKVYLPKSTAESLNLEYNHVLPQQYADTQLVDLHYEFFTDLTFEMIPEANISMINANEEVRPYFDEYTSFDYVFKVKKHHTPLAHTFYNAELSFLQMILDIDVVVLPHPKLITPFDINEVIIRDIIGIESEDHLLIPNWIDTYNTKRQENLIDDIKQLEVQINALKQQVKEKQTEFDLIRDFQRILFTQGELFRQSLLAVFRSLGMKVSEPGGILSHDLELESAEAVFVIQVVTIDGNTLERSVLRKLNQWVEKREEMLNFSKPVKGVAIVNYDIKTDPKFRPKLELNAAAENYVSKLEFCILTAPLAFELYTEVEKGNFGKFELLEIISQYTGIFEYTIQTSV